MARTISKTRLNVNIIERLAMIKGYPVLIAVLLSRVTVIWQKIVELVSINISRMKKSSKFAHIVNK